MVELRILGPPQLLGTEGKGAERLSRQPKRTALLAYLAAASPRGFHRRDKLLGLFWPELDAPHARNALSQALHLLRSALGDGAIVARGDAEVGLDPHVLWCDAAAFETALDAGRPAEALELYRGDLLDGLFIPAAPGFERWLDEARGRLRQRASEGAWAVAESAAQAGNPVEAGRWARRAADLLPADEAAARRLMRFLYGLGDRAAAIRAYDGFTETLSREYELDPSAETRALAAAIREGEGPAVAATPLMPGAPAVPPEEPRSPDGGAMQSSPTPAAATPLSGEARPARSRAFLPAMAAAFALATLLLYGFVARSGTGWITGVRTPRIVVLPFQNLGLPEDGYFAAGLTDEITARLAIAGGLDVIGGNAAARYRDALADPGPDRRPPAVDYILDGTVTWQRAPGGPGQVRIRPRLVDARNDASVWAAVFDDDLADLGDLFALLSGVADRVVEELHVAVDSPERAPAAAPTTSLEAYDAYLRGREFKMRSWSPTDTRASIELLERAVALDPGFALAHAWLAFAHTEAFWLNGFPADHLDRAREAAELALRLDPALPDAHKAMGHLLYVCCEDYDRALAHLKESHAARPGDAQVVMFIGNLHKRQGRWDDALAYYERASGLDPGWPAPFFNIAQMELWRRRYDRVERAIGRALALDPQAAFAFSMGAWVPLLRDGDSDGARRVLHRAAQTSEAFESIRLPFYLALLDRDYAAAARVAERGSHSGEALDEWLDSDHLRRGVLSRLIGDEAAATLHFDSARLAIEQGLRDALPRSRRTQAALRSALAVSYAGMGRLSEAMAEADRVRALDPVAIDAISGPISLQNVALAYVFLDEHDAALDVLEQLVRIPARLSPALLRVDPLWDPLRPHPRFTRLGAP